MRQLMLSAAVLAALLGMTACGDDDDDTGGGATTAGGAATTAAGGTAGDSPAEATITITEFAFPAETRIVAGQPLTVTNDTGAAHTVTADDDSFNEEVEAGASIELVVSEPGSYPYHCNFHANMTGVLVVE